MNKKAIKNRKIRNMIENYLERTYRMIESEQFKLLKIEFDKEKKLITDNFEIGSEEYNIRTQKLNDKYLTLEREMLI